MTKASHISRLLTVGNADVEIDIFFSFFSFVFCWRGGGGEFPELSMISVEQAGI